MRAFLILTTSAAILFSSAVFGQESKRGKRASHLDPPASSYAIMRKACPYRGENNGPGKDVQESLTRGPELENRQGQIKPLNPKKI